MAALSKQASELGTLRLLVRLWHRLRPRRRKQIVVVSFLMVLSTFGEVLTLGAVIPFITVLVEPERVFEIRLVAEIAQSLNLDRAEDLVVPLAVVFVAAALLAVAFRMAVLWVTTRLVVATGADLSAEAYERTLYQPYATHVSRNTSDVISGVVHKVEAIVSGMLAPFQTAVGSILTIAAVTGVLIFLDPVVALIAMTTVGGGYVITTRVFRNRLTRNSQLIDLDYTRVVRAIQEGIGGIREVLIDGTQPMFLAEFADSDRRRRHAQGSNGVINQAPRIMMEGVAVVLISMLAVALSGRSGGVAGSLPLLGALALGGQRLLPLYNQAYSAVSTVLGHRALLVNALEILEQPLPESYGLPIPPPLEIETELRCRHLRFRYAESGPWVINDLELTIAKGTRIGLVGATGCGKSTLLDLLMGLLVPTEGEVLVDGRPFAGNRLRAWQRSIAHVPQHIFLADASISENIAFGIPVEDIEMDRVHEAARRAVIADFAEGKPMGYATVVGERGVRLSGGQRQRIGIARALYKQASVLVFDEATSALDNQTEQSVIDSLVGLDREVTVILVAHRLTTLKDCDVILELGDGRIIGEGTFETLLSTSPTFREMTLASEPVT